MIRKYTMSLSLGVQDALEYRANFLLSMVSVLFPVFIQIFLWVNLYGDEPETPLFGYTFPQMLSYVLYANIVSRLVRTGFEYTINRDIKDGILSTYIVKPVSYFWYRLFNFVGQKLVHTLLILVFLAIVIVFNTIAYGAQVSALRIAVFLVSLIVSFVLNFAIFFSVGMFGFWFHEIGFLFEAVRIVIIVFSGGVFPLDIFGDTLKSVLGYLPFAYTIYFPSNIISGRIPLAHIPGGLALQCIWTILACITAGSLFSIGIKKYSATGG